MVRNLLHLHDTSLSNETKEYVIDMRINFVRQRRNERTGWGRLIYMRINFMHLGDVLMLIYICSHEEWLYLFRFEVISWMKKRPEKQQGEPSKTLKALIWRNIKSEAVMKFKRC